MEKESENKAALRECARHLELELFGVADITPIRGEFLLREELRAGFDRGVAIGSGF